MATQLVLKNQPKEIEGKSRGTVLSIFSHSYTCTLTHTWMGRSLHGVQGEGQDNTRLLRRCHNKTTNYIVLLFILAF